MEKKTLVSRWTAFQVHAMRQLLHRHHRLRVGRGRDRGPGPPLNVPVEDFEQDYLSQVGIRKSLIEYDNGDCVFFDTEARRCTVYEDRPRRCARRWESTLAPNSVRVCPGSGEGNLVPLEKILEQLKVVRL